MSARGAGAGQRGFTLIQVIVTIAIVGILMTIAVPSFQTMLYNSRRTGATNELLGAIQFARNEALKRGQSVAICAVDPAHAACSPKTAVNATDCQCSASATDWKTGWITFVNVDNATPVDIDANDVILNYVSNDYTGITISATAATYAFRPFNVRMAAGTITICDPRGAGNANARGIIIETVGRTRLSSSTNHAGSALTCP